MVDTAQPGPGFPGGGESPALQVASLYKELRRVAAGCLRRERPNHTLQPTALVNEAYLRLAAQSLPNFGDKTRFLAIASHLMREILVDYARTRNREKRGGGQILVSFEDTTGLSSNPEIDVLALDEALSRLERNDPQQRQIVELRYFGGLNIEETAEALGISPATVKRDWRVAKAWLHRELSGEAPA
jgi:RNA polymerase sigma-70 factor (ECF subfamily)